MCWLICRVTVIHSEFNRGHGVGTVINESAIDSEIITILQYLRY